MSRTANIPHDIHAGGDNLSLPWYKERPAELSSSTKDLLLDYSAIPEDQIIPHICKVVRGEQGEAITAPLISAREMPPGLCFHTHVSVLFASLIPHSANIHSIQKCFPA